MLLRDVCQGGKITEKSTGMMSTNFSPVVTGGRGRDLIMEEYAEGSIQFLFLLWFLHWAICIQVLVLVFSFQGHIKSYALIFVYNII